MKFQPVPASTKRERNLDPADSGKKVLPGVELVPLFRGLEQRRGSTFFSCVQDFFDVALSLQYGKCHWGRNEINGNVLRGGVVLIMILPGGVIGN